MSDNDLYLYHPSHLDAFTYIERLTNGIN